jgi:hypothetical protein
MRTMGVWSCTRTDTKQILRWTVACSGSWCAFNLLKYFYNLFTLLEVANPDILSYMSLRSTFKSMLLVPLRRLTRRVLDLQLPEPVHHFWVV